MQPNDYHFAARAYLVDRDRDAAQLQIEAEARKTASVRTRLPLMSRLRVFVTGRIDAVDVGWEPVRPRKA